LSFAGKTKRGCVFSCKGGSGNVSGVQPSSASATVEIVSRVFGEVRQGFDFLQRNPQSLYLSGLAFKGVGCFGARNQRLNVPVAATLFGHPKGNGPRAVAFLFVGVSPHGQTGYVRGGHAPLQIQIIAPTKAAKVKTALIADLRMSSVRIERLGNISADVRRRT
jgi:hypothetical protein